ncbi:MAG: kelch repeat-containing protein [Planctomycetota bacterium]
MRPVPCALLAFLLLASAGCKDEKTNLPFIVAETPPGVVTGPVPVFYTLFQQATRPVTVIAEFSRDRGVTFQRATEAQGQPNPAIINAQPAGLRAFFYWDPLEDLGPGLHRDVVVRVFGPGEGAIPSDTAPLVVDLTDRLAAPSSLAALRADEAVGLPLLDGSVVVAGGRDQTGALSNQVQRYQAHLDQVVALPALSVARTAIAAARLADGSLLFAGGTASGGVSGAVERLRFDANEAPSLETPSAGLLTPRALAAVAPLADGRALVLGGRGAGNAVLSSVELFTPGAPVQLAYTSPLAARAGASATRLGDGRVLLVGGVDAAGAARADVALIQGGAAGTTLGGISAGGNLTVARAEHAALLLPDGRVFLAGGTVTLGSDAGALASVEIYDPATNTTQAVASLRRVRRRPGLAYVDGAVVAFGGSGGSDSATTAERYELASNEWVDIAGPSGTSRPAPTAVTYGPGLVLVVGGTLGAERYVADADVISQSFDAYTTLLPPRADHTATTLPDGRVLIAGGTALITSATADVRLFDPLLGTLTPRASLLRARAGHAAALAGDGRLLVVGGADKDGLVATAELYSEPLDRWEAVGNLQVPRRDPTLTSVGYPSTARLLVIGGTDKSGAPVSAVELWDPVSRSFSTLGSLPEGRVQHQSVATFDHLFIGPGRGPAGPLATCLLLDTLGSSAATITLAAARAEAAVSFTADRRRVLVSGGSDAGGLRGDAELVEPDFFPAPFVLSERPQLVVARRGHRAVDQPGRGRVLLVGGVGKAGVAIDDAELFGFAVFSSDQLTGTQGNFVRTADRTMNRPRARFTATQLADGRVLIVGGVDERGVAIAGAELFVP